MNGRYEIKGFFIIEGFCFRDVNYYGKNIEILIFTYELGLPIFFVRTFIMLLLNLQDFFPSLRHCRVAHSVVAGDNRVILFLGKPQKRKKSFF